MAALLARVRELADDIYSAAPQRCKWENYVGLDVSDDMGRKWEECISESNRLIDAVVDLWLATRNKAAANGVDVGENSPTTEVKPG